MQNNTASVIELSKFVATPDSDLVRSQPFTIAFVYSAEGNFIVKGMNKAVQTYIAQHFPFCFYKYTFWKNGKSRGSWRAPKNLQLYFTKRVTCEKRSFHYVTIICEDGKRIELKFRNIPKKWLPVFDKAAYKKTC